MKHSIENNMGLAMISGCGHTGTTLLSRMLGTHSRVYNPPYETNIFLAYNVLEWNTLLKSQFSDANLAKKDCRILLEKTPRHIWHIDYVSRVIPEAKFILMTRKCHDVVASLYERTGDIHGAITRYKDDSLLTVRQLDNPSALLIRYEDLVNDPHSQLISVTDF